MAVLLALHLLAAVAVLLGGRLLGRWVLAVAAAPLAAAAVWLLTQLAGVLDGDGPARRLPWVGDLGLSLSFRLDGFALLMGLAITLIGLLVLAYSASYFGPDTEPGLLVRFAGLFVAFAGAMLGLVLADDLWTLLLFWEATSVTSFLLIGLDDRSPSARAAALRALLVTGSGGLCMLGGIALLAVTTGTTSLPALAADTPAGTAVSVSLVLLLLGAFTKSAQVPFHFWLPGAMAAPTPVSAYLHSATMVKAGIVLVGRLAPLFATLGWWRPLLVCVGGATMVLGGLRALRQTDAKLLLAHGTVSQLGFLMVLFGIGLPEATAAGVAVLAAHALFKAALFLVVGIVDHATGTRDIRRLDGVGRALPWVAGLAAVAGVSMAGIPPTFGFVAKESALAGLLDARDGWATVALVGVCVGSVLTVAYTARWWFGVFTGRPSSSAPPLATGPATVHHRPSAAFVTPVVLLVAGTLAFGLAPALVRDLLATAAESLDDGADVHLALWGGFHLPLLLSVLIVVAGLGLVVPWGRFDTVHTDRWPSGERVYQGLFDGLLDGAGRLTAVVQSGSLPAYLAVVFSVLVAAVVAAVAGGAGPGGLDTVVADSALQVVVAGVGMVLALAAVAARRRFVSVLLLGAVGYVMVVVFLMYGAPDLALTQFLAETLSLVVFLLVLRQLPEDYASPPAWAPRALRIGIAVAVGVAMSGFALIAGTSRTDWSVPERMIDEALPIGGGHNVVNVVVIDIRSVDTMGEITVLAVAAMGVANLVAAARRARAARPGATDGEAGAPLSIGARSVVFDQTSRLMFHLILLSSLYITFRGHNAPGGGFAGGLIAGAAFAVRFLAGGQPALARLPRLAPTALVGSGVLLAVGTGLLGMVGGEFLESAIVRPHLPLVGEVKIVTSAFLDIGVYLVVLGVVLTLLANLGAGATTDTDPPADAAPPTPAVTPSPVEVEIEVTA